MKIWLRLLPKSFRARHGAELEETLRAMQADLGPSPSRLALLRLHATATLDALRLWMAPGSWEMLTADLRFALRQFARTWAASATMLAILTVVLPQGAAATAVVGEAYFDGEDSLTGLVVLLVWVAVGVGALVALGRRDEPAADATP